MKVGWVWECGGGFWGDREGSGGGGAGEIWGDLKGFARKLSSRGRGLEGFGGGGVWESLGLFEGIWVVGIRL